MKHHCVSKDVAKKLPITLLFGGTYQGWIKENNISVNDDNKLEKELKPIMDIVYIANKQIKVDVRPEEVENRK